MKLLAVIIALAFSSAFAGSKAADLIKAVQDSNTDEAIRIIGAPGFVDAGDRNGMTGLMNAAALGQSNVVSALLKSGRCSIDAQDKEGKTALYWAVFTQKHEVLRLLLAAGASRETKAKDGKSALDLIRGDRSIAIIFDPNLPPEPPPVERQRVTNISNPTPTPTFSQVKEENGSYSGVVEIPGAKAGEIYIALKKYIASSYVSAKAVIQAEDKEAGMIEGNGSMEITGTLGEGAPLGGGMGTVTYKISFRVKDGKFKYTFSDLIHTWKAVYKAATYTYDGGSIGNDKPDSGGFLGMPVKTWRNIQQKARENVMVSIDRLKAYVPNEIKKGDDF